MTSNESESSDDWENFSSDSSSSEEENIQKTDKLSPVEKSAQSIMPWSPSELEIVENDGEKIIAASKFKNDAIKIFKTDAELNEHLHNFFKVDDIFDDKTAIRNIFELAMPGYRQIGHDSNKTICVEFDSLFTTILNMPEMKRGGFQSLTLIYLAERLLQRLQIGDRPVEIDVFKSHFALYKNFKNRLLRSILLHHLVKTKISPIKFFRCCQSVEWHKNLQLVSPSFVLISTDGFRFENHFKFGKNPNSNLNSENISDVALSSNNEFEFDIFTAIKTLCLGLFTKGFLTVRLEELFFKSNAIFGFVYKVFPSLKQFLLAAGFSSNKNSLNKNQNEIEGETQTENCIKNQNKIEGEIEKISFNFLTIKTIKKFLNNEKIKVNPILKEFAAKTFLLCQNLKNEIDIENRCFFEVSNVDFFNKIDQIKFLEIDSKTLFNEICQNCDFFVNDEYCENLSGDFRDFFDERFFEKIIELIVFNRLTQNSFSIETQKNLQNDWNEISKNNFFPLKNEIEKYFNIKKSPLIKAEKEVKTHSLHDLKWENLPSLTKSVDQILEEKKLLYKIQDKNENKDESCSNENIQSFSDDLFIFDEIEQQIRDAEQNKTAHVETQEMLKENIRKIKFYAFMKKYSETLASPKIVLRDVVVEENLDENNNSLKNSKNSSKNSSNNEKTTTKKQKGEKKSKKGKGSGKKSSNQRKLEISNRILQKKKQKAKEDMLIFIEQALRPLPLAEKIRKLDEKLLPIKDPLIALPGQIQLLQWLREYYRHANSESSKEAATLLFRSVFDIFRRFGRNLSLEDLDCLQYALMLMGFVKESRMLVDDYNCLVGKSAAKVVDFSNDIYCEPIGLSCVRFQLKHGGHFMVRSIKSREDPRVSNFFPDDWQRSFLDAVDKGESCLVVTPTSSGKTFISFYAMKQMLIHNRTAARRSDKQFTVFVCPSKALVNQVSADIYARYGEIFGVQTLDYSKNVLECEVLVTVPESFEKILLSPAYEPFVRRVKYVIMDEVHSIGDPLGGEIWERILLLIQCPFIALSATLGKPKKFHNWLQKISNYGDKQKPKVNLIEFYERWSDLEKYVYLPKEVLKPRLNQSDFEGKFKLNSLVHINPLSAFALGVFSADKLALDGIDLSSNDCLEIYDAFFKTIKSNKTDKNRDIMLENLRPLDPEKFFVSTCITKNDVRRYSVEFKKLIINWNNNGFWTIIFNSIQLLSEDLLKKFKHIEKFDYNLNIFAKNSKNNHFSPNSFDNSSKIPENTKNSSKTSQKTTEKTNDKTAEKQLKSLPNSEKDSFDGVYSIDFLRRHFLPLLLELRESGDLPAIVFAKSQKLCDQLTLETLKFFEENEKFVMSKGEMKEIKKNKKAQIKSIKQWKRERDKIDKRKEEEMMKEGTIPVVDTEEDDINTNFSLLNPGEQMDPDSAKYWLSRTLSRNNWSKNHPFLRCISRGIAVHHNGMTRAYRTLVEVLFRQKHIKVVITVGTLALGVNMPCRTTVFAGDNAELTPLRYRQMMGRAGRRGYDNIGKVIFFGVPPDKISYLMTSSLISLHGHNNMTMTTFLRNLFSISEATDKEFRLSSFKNMMKSSFSRREEDAENFDKESVKNHIELFYRFSMEYLYQNKLIDSSLRPINFAGIVSRLYASEPANFVFAIFLQEGIFDKICSAIPESHITTDKNIEKTKAMKSIENEVSTRLIETLAHIFFRVPLPTGFRRPPNVNSKVVLPPLDETASAVLYRFNRTTTALYSQFHRLVTVVLSDKNLDCLPLSNKIYAEKNSQKEIINSSDEKNNNLNENSIHKILNSESFPPKSRSFLAALCGGSDNFDSSASLRRSGRPIKIDLSRDDEVPTIESKSVSGEDLPLNAYVVDFFNQGSLAQVVKENDLPELFAWQQLKQWSLTLRHIKSSMSIICEKQFGGKPPIKWKRLRYSFCVLSEQFDESFTKIGDLVNITE